MPTKIPPWATRHAACTHLSMERLYGDYRCNLCHRPSQLGWVYLCTQDDVESPGFDLVNKILRDRISMIADQRETSPTSKKPTHAVPSSPDPIEDIPEFQMPTNKLAPWMEKAITHGHYTPDQVKVLRTQRQNVVDVANAAIEQYEREGMFKGTTPAPVVSASESTKHSAAAIEHQEPQHSPKLKMFPYCKFRSCQACRPTFRERTWGRFEDVYTKEVSAIVKSENYDFHSTRPLASLEVLRTIGLKALSSSKPRPHRLRRLRPGSFSESGLRLRGMENRLKIDSLPYDTEGDQVTNVATQETQDVGDAGLDIDSEPSGLREGMMRAFRGVLNRCQSSHSITKRKVESESETSLDLALRKCLNDSVLQEAASVPLPEPTSVGGLVAEIGDAEEVQLVEGAAVMEESAEIGTVDIITSI